MKLMKLGLQPQITLKPVPRGSEFAAFLVNQAGMDSVLMRGQIEDACVRDLITYFGDKKIRCTDDWLRTLIKAELAGGNFAAINMPERLSRQLANLSADSIAGGGITTSASKRQTKERVREIQSWGWVPF